MPSLVSLRKAPVTGPSTGQVGVLTDSGASGTANLLVTEATVTPTGNSTRQVFAGQETLTYNSPFSVADPGYSCIKQFNMVLAGTGTHAKAVGQLTQVSAVGGNVTALLGIESEPLAIGPTTQVANYAAFYCANVAGVPNVSNIQLFYAFSNDHIGAPANPLARPAIIKNAGITVSGALNELAPAAHPGLVANRYYSAPCATVSPAAVSANVLYFVPVHIPHRTNVTKLGVNVTTGAAGNVVLGLYRSAQTGFPGQTNGVPTTLVAQTTSQSTAAAAAVEAAITLPAGYIDAGLYFVAAVFSAEPTVSQHNIDPSRIAQHGGTTPTDTGLVGFAPLAFNATLPPAVGALTYAAQASEPRLWFRL